MSQTHEWLETAAFILLAAAPIYLTLLMILS